MFRGQADVVCEPYSSHAQRLDLEGQTSHAAVLTRCWKPVLTSCPPGFRRRRRAALAQTLITVRAVTKQFDQLSSTARRILTPPDATASEPIPFFRPSGREGSWDACRSTLP